MNISEELVRTKKTAFCIIRRDPQGNKKVTFLAPWKDAIVNTQEAITSHISVPNAGIAILTGQESNLTVIDFDTKDNPLYTELFTACPTYCVETNKGFHLYYQYEEALKQGAERLGHKVDIRNNGGIIFSPPTSGYKAYDGYDISKLNSEAKRILESHVAVGQKDRIATKDITATESRNDSLFRKVCGLLNIKPKQAVYNEMLIINSKFTKGALSDKEVEGVWQQAIKYHDTGVLEIVKNQGGCECPEIHELGLDSYEKNGKVIYKRHVENICRLLSSHPKFKGTLRFDRWLDRMQIKNNNAWSSLEDKDYVTLWREITMVYPQFGDVSKAYVIDAIEQVCYENAFDSAIADLKSVEWDRIDRLSTWINVVYGTPITPYTTAVGANFIKGMVKRIVHAGCKVDGVLILEGKQGNMKSTSLTVLSGDRHIETTMKADTKDFFLQFKGKSIVEFSEGKTLSATEVSALKSIITTATDTYRSPYGRIAKDHARRCVFAMTTNETEYLKDMTGNRRFFPVEVIRDDVDIEWIKENRSQLLAEALYRVEVLNETVYEYPIEEAEAVRASKMMKSGLEEHIAEWVNRPVGLNGNIIDLFNVGVKSSDVWIYALNGFKSSYSKLDEMRVGQAMANLGLKRVLKRLNGVPCKVWILEEK